MTRWPKVPNARLTGFKGAQMVARIVNDELGWLFRAVPQEVDVGIDGYLDVVTPDGETPIGKS